jgi:NAD-dependent deacetylase
MLVIGTSGIVQPAASLAFEAKSGGAVVAEINIDRTPQSGVMDFVLIGEAGKILPMIVEGLD